MGDMMEDRTGDRMEERLKRREERTGDMMENKTGDRMEERLKRREERMGDRMEDRIRRGWRIGLGEDGRELMDLQDAEEDGEEEGIV